MIGGPERGQGPGSGTIFFSNCSMKCAYCQNYKISGIFSNAAMIGKEILPAQLVEMMLDLQRQGAMNINFVTGTHYRSHIITAARAAREQGLTIPIVYNTSGYETVASISALASVVDVFLPDFKYSDNELCRELSINNISDYSQIAIDAISTMLDFCGEAKHDIFCGNARMTQGVVVRHLMLPGQLQNSKDALRMLYDNFSNEIKYSIMNQYTPVMDARSPVANQHPELFTTPDSKDYEELLDYADDLGIKDYFWQDGPACKESFIPDFE